jgi:hypothetical protein
MTTHVLRKRFTAAEALEFFAGIYGTLSQDQLNAPAPPMYDPSTRHAINPWAGVPESFAKAWAPYRSPDVSLATLVLRRICRTEKGYLAVQWIRKAVAFFWRIGNVRQTAAEINSSYAQSDFARRDGQTIS